MSVISRTMVFCLFAASGAALIAQTGVGRIQGVVRDRSGAAVPAASVAAVHSATQVKYQTKSNEVGSFVIPSLPPGVYHISVLAEGMARYSANLELAVGQTADLEIMLEVATTQTSVTVAAEATQLLTSDSPTVSTNLENQRLEQLPLDGRFLQNLLMNTVPGLEGNSNTPQVFGMREGAFEFTLDGAVLSSRFNTAMEFRAPGLDSVSEVRVETSVPSAKLNRPATAIISTKSGTNEFHGAAFYTARNNAIGVARRREQYTAAPKLIRNEFGASLGGPVRLGRLYDGRNRTFFFASWEDYRARQSADRQAAIPTMPMRQGDFSELRDNLGRFITIYDPYTTAGADQRWARTPYPGNRIPTVQESPLARQLYPLIPEPTFAEINPGVAANFFKSYPSRNDQRTFSLRADHRISAAHTFFSRISRGTSEQYEPAFEARPAPVLLDESGNVRTQDKVNYSLAGNWGWVVAPSFFVETTGNFSRMAYRADRAHPSAGADLAKRWGLPNPKGRLGAPDLLNMGFDMTVRGPFADDNQNTIFTLDQNYSKLSGKHQFEFGWHWREDSVFVIPRQYPNQVEVDFNSYATSGYDPATGNSIGARQLTGHNAANFFLGVAGAYNVGIRRPHYTVRTGEVAAYFNDQWRVSRNLTVNLGVRWESFAPFSEKDNNMVGFDIPSLAIVVGNPPPVLIRQGQTTSSVVQAYEALGTKFTTPDKVGLPSRFLYRKWADFNPRIGPAFRTKFLGRPLVLRGGFGGYHFALPTRTYHQPLRGNAPFDATVTRSINRADQSPDGLPNWGMRSVPSIVAGMNSQNAVSLDGPIPLGRGFTVHHMQAEMPTAVAWEWNFTAEHEFIPRTVFRLGYTGTAGRNQEQWEALNVQVTPYVWYVTTGEPLPTGTYANTARRSIDKLLYGEMRVYRPEAYNNFNGLRAELERRFSRGVAFQFYYMFSHAMGTGWAPSNSGYSAPDEVVTEAAAFLPGAVPSDYKQRARFLTYKRDRNIPHHRYNWNFLMDLPIGRGKRWLNTRSRWLDSVVGGWQVAGLGSWRSRWFELPDTNWGTIGKPEYYGTKYKIQDCRSGQCFDGYLYYNGYISARVLNQPGGIVGVPAEYRPSHQPVNPAPAPGQSSAIPQTLWDTNQVTLTLRNGSTVRTNLDTFLHPWRTQIGPGPWKFGMDASLFKRIRVREGITLRLNFDAFNVFNVQGLPLPDASTGIVSLRNSDNTPRQLQFTARLQW